MYRNHDRWITRNGMSFYPLCHRRIELNYSSPNDALKMFSVINLTSSIWNVVRLKITISLSLSPIATFLLTRHEINFIDYYSFSWNKNWIVSIIKRAVFIKRTAKSLVSMISDLEFDVAFCIPHKDYKNWEIL